MAFWPQTGFIRQNEFLVHKAQLVSVSTSEWGDSVESSATTIVCYFYEEGSTSFSSAPITTDKFKHYAIIPSSVTIGVDYHLRSITDPNGTVIQTSARVDAIHDYNSHRYGARIKLLNLEIATI